jgi:hypothetical protein
VGPSCSHLAYAGPGAPVTALPVADRTALWTPLVRTLTREFPDWTIWKNADAALAGSGDIDSAAPARDWDAIVIAFRRWAHACGLGPVVECRHPPRTMFLVALDETRRTFLELDVLGRKYFRGGTLFRAEDLIPLSQLDHRGFRVIRPAAQALILLLCNGLRWGGRQDIAGIRKRRIAALLEADLDGVGDAARCLHLPERAVRAAALRLLNGEWDRRSMLTIEGSALLRSFREPRVIASRVRFRTFSKKSCPLLRAIFYGDRVIPGDPESWLRELRRGHRVYE